MQKNAEKFMSSKEQKTPEGQAPEEIITEQHDEVEAVEPEVSAEQVDPRDEKIANLEAQLVKRRIANAMCVAHQSGNGKPASSYRAGR
jgi:molecular chaperone GrpE